MKRFAPLAIGLLTAALYLPRLGDVPAFLMPDEVTVGVGAQSIAATGREPFHGRLLPLFVQYSRKIVGHRGVGPGEEPGIRESWLPPAIFYTTALALQVLPLNEWTLRLPTALIGIGCVVLLYFVALRLFRDAATAAAAATALALTPSLLIHSRLAADYLYPVLFVLAWLLFLLRYIDHGKTRDLVLAGAMLGVGFYSYAAAAIVMPIQFAVTIAVLWLERRTFNAHAIAFASFFAPISLALAWIATHPQMFAEVLRKYELDSGGSSSITSLLHPSTAYHAVGDWLGRWWGFFNPRFLFFDGPMEPMFSTREAGVFLLPLALLMPYGLYVVATRTTRSRALLVVGGLLTAPLAATIVNVNDAIYRALEMLPFAALAAGAGLVALWAVPRLRPVVTLIVVISVAQYAFFYRDYMTAYRVRSSLVFSGNIRGAFEEAIEEARQSPPPAIYLGEIGPYAYGELYWTFYLLKHQRTDLLERTTNAWIFYADRVRALPPGSIAITNASDGAVDPIVDRMVAEGLLTKKTIHEPDGSPSFLVLRRTAATGGPAG